MHKKAASTYQVLGIGNHLVLRIGILLAVFLVEVGESQTVGLLYDQIDNPSGNGVPDQDFEAAFDAYDCEGADDFRVTWPTGWVLDRVNTIGTTGTPGGALVDITILRDNGGSPEGGLAICSYDDVPPTADVLGSLTVDLPSPCNASLGLHWVVVQVNQNFGTFGQHFWSNRTVQSHAPGHWRNPAGGFGLGCTDWTPQTACGVGGGTSPDFLFSLGGSASSTPIIDPVDFEFLVNDQAMEAAQSQGAIATGRVSKDFVVVWQNRASEFEPARIRARYLDAAGVPVGSSIAVGGPLASLDDASNPQIAAGDDDFLVVWEQRIGLDFEILARRLGATALPLGPVFKVNDLDARNQQRPVVAATDDGEFLVVWQSELSPGDDAEGLSVVGRRIDSLGVPIGDDFQVNDEVTAGDQACPSVSLVDDLFVVAFQSGEAGTGADCQPGTSEGVVPIDIRTVFGRFATLEILEDLPVSGAFCTNVRPQIVSRNRDEIDVVWERGREMPPCAGSSTEGVVPIDIGGVRGRFSFVGVSLEVDLGTEVSIETSDGNASRPDLQALGGGYLAVLWERDDLLGSEEIFGRIAFTMEDFELVPEFQANTVELGDQRQVATVPAREGMVAIWTSDPLSGTSLGSSDVKGQRFRVLGVPFFADGFESGDTSFWSTVRP